MKNYKNRRAIQQPKEMNLSKISPQKIKELRAKASKEKAEAKRSELKKITEEIKEILKSTKKASKKEVSEIVKEITDAVNEEKRRENIRKAVEFEYADLTEQSIAMQNKTLEKMGHDIKGINKLREDLANGKIKNNQEFIERFNLTKTELFKNKGVLKTKKRK